MRLLRPLLLTALALILNVAARAQTAAPVASPLGPPVAAATLPAATLQLLRSHQVWLDELPDKLDPSQLEVVVISADSRCRPQSQKVLFGLTVNPLNPVTGALCRRLASFIQTPPEPLTLAVRLHTGADLPRQPGAALAALEPAPARRYVALVHWSWSQPQRDLHWAFEAVVIDRQNGRPVWHGARAHEVWMAPEWQEKTERRALQALLQHELPRDLLDRGWWREAMPMATARWVAPAELATYRPAVDRAALVVVNSYASSQHLQDDVVLRLWPVGTAEVDETPALRALDWSRLSTVRRAQATPPLAPARYVVLDLPAGAYEMRVYSGVERHTLEPGRLTVLNIQRGFSNAKTMSVATEVWWREKVLGERGRHAFLPEPPSRGWPAVVPHFDLSGP